MPKIQIKVGDIVNFDADAVVIVTNEDLEPVPGVCEAIFAAESPRLGSGTLAQEICGVELERNKKCPTGFARVTHSKSGYLIHAVPPDAKLPTFSDPIKQNFELARMFFCIFKIAASLRIKTLALPTIGWDSNEIDPYRVAMMGNTTWDYFCRVNPDVAIEVVFVLSKEFSGKREHILIVPAVYEANGVGEQETALAFAQVDLAFEPGKIPEVFIPGKTQAESKRGVRFAEIYDSIDVEKLIAPNPTIEFERRSVAAETAASLPSPYGSPRLSSYGQARTALSAASPPARPPVIKRLFVDPATPGQDRSVASDAADKATSSFPSSAATAVSTRREAGNSNHNNNDDDGDALPMTKKDTPT